MESDDLFESLLARCIKLIYIRPRTESEINKYLNKLTEDQHLIERLISRLKDNNYLKTMNLSSGGFPSGNISSRAGRCC